MTYWVFLGLAVFGSLYFLFRRRVFDLFSLGFVSSLVYFAPLFVNVTMGSARFTSVPVETEVYVIGSSVLLGLTICGEMVNRLLPELTISVRQYKRRSLRITLALGLLAALALAGLVGMVWNVGEELFAARKGEIMQVLSRYRALMVFASVLGLTAAFLARRWLMVAVFLSLLLLDVYIGFRWGAAIGFLGVVFCWFAEEGKRPLYEILMARKKRLLAIFASGAFFFLYKRIFVPVKQGDWDVVVGRLANFDTYRNAMVHSEPFVTQSILNRVVSEGFRTDGIYLTQNILQLIPFSSAFGADLKSFNSFYQPALFPTVPGGMANNWWAEWFAAYCWSGIAVALLVYLGVLFILTAVQSMYRRNLMVVALVTVCGVLAAFYIHRNDVTFFITLEKRALGVWLLVVGVTGIVYGAASGGLGREACARADEG